MLYEYPQYVIYNEYAHMNRIRYFFRIHLKGITRIYRLFRRIMRNAFYVRLMGVGKLKKADTFFFVIDPRFNHPGLADRMKAIIACYNEAKKNGLHFKIVFKQPFVLEDYLHPTSIDNDWVADFRDLEYSFFKTRFVDEKRGWHLSATSGCQYHCYNYTGDIIPEIFENTGYKWHELYHELFTPNEEIVRAIHDTGMPPQSYCAIHLRFVNALEDFEEGHYNRLSTESEKQLLIERCKAGIRKIIACNPHKKMLVFSDSKIFLHSLDELPVETLNPDTIGHICFNNNHEQVLKAFLDQYMISLASKVYMITAPEMYSSSCFSLCGARIGGVEFEHMIV